MKVKSINPLWVTPEKFTKESVMGERAFCSQTDGEGGHRRRESFMDMEECNLLGELNKYGIININ